jgi:hypothetical protein
MDFFILQFFNVLVAILAIEHYKRKFFICHFLSKVYLAHTQKGNAP